MNKTTPKIDNLKVELPCISTTTNEQKTVLTSNPPKIFIISNLFSSKCDNFFGNFPKSFLDHVAWDF
jgi:hypothetical protein